MRLAKWLWGAWLNFRYPLYVIDRDDAIPVYEVDIDAIHYKRGALKHD